MKADWLGRDIGGEKQQKNENTGNRKKGRNQSVKGKNDDSDNDDVDDEDDEDDVDDAVDDLENNEKK